MKKPIAVGEKHQIICGASEACLHMKVTDKPMLVELTPGPYPMAQLYSLDGKPFSFPITTGEAGIYHEGSGENYRFGIGFYINSP